MRRLGSLAALLVAALAWFAAGAVGEDTHVYRVEFDNAFGITKGSQVRVAGVNVGVVREVEINAAKRAEVEVEVSGELSTFGTETKCSSEPQSLIAEYFVDCDPHGPPLEEGGLIPVGQTRQTVQPDLVQATLREPFRQRLALLINEFGTGLAGNAGNLNAAIRRGAPALGELDSVIETLADRNDLIAATVSDSDRVLGELAARKQDVSRFIRATREFAGAGAARREELSQSFDRLDDFLGELTPTLGELRAVSQASAPLLSELEGAADELDHAAGVLPGFAASSESALRSLGRASAEGTAAIEEGKQEIDALARSGLHAKDATEPLKHFVRDVDDPRRIVEIDDRAARRCDDETKPCWSTGREAPTGYTGLEGVLNYAYYLAGATNQVDQVSHILHVSIYSVANRGDPCGLGWWTGREADGTVTGVPKAGGGKTTSLLEADPCVSWVGPNQPGINQRVELPPYDPAVCPNGSLAPELCDPEGSEIEAKRGELRKPGDPQRKISGADKPDRNHGAEPSEPPARDPELGGLLPGLDGVLDSLPGGNPLGGGEKDGRRDRDGDSGDGDLGTLLDLLIGGGP